MPPKNRSTILPPSPKQAGKKPVETPERILEFLRNFNEAAPHLNDEEKLKMKNDFLALEKKYVKKAIIEKQKQQELRKLAFQQQIKQYEHELIIQQADEHKRAQQQRNYRAQQMEQQMRAIRDGPLSSQEKVAELQKLLEELDSSAKMQ